MEQGLPLHIILNYGCILSLYRGAAKVSGLPEQYFNLGPLCSNCVPASGPWNRPNTPPPESYSTIFGNTLMVTL